MRLDGRFLVTLMDGSITRLICSAGRCLTGLHVTLVSQADFSDVALAALPLESAEQFDPLKEIYNRVEATVTPL